MALKLKPQVIELWYDERTFNATDDAIAGLGRQHLKAAILADIVFRMPNYVVSDTVEHDSHGWVFGVRLIHQGAADDWQKKFASNEP